MNQPNQQLAKTTAKAISPIDALRSTLNSMEGQFKLVLPPHVPAEKFIRTVLTAVQGNLDLLAADRTSLFTSCMECATDGLLPDGREAAIVTFRNNKKGCIEAAYMPMVGGLLKMMRNSGELATITPNIVCESDEFDYWIDETGEHIKHKPFLGGPRGELTHAYVIVRNKDGSHTYEVMSKFEIEQVRECAKAKDTGPWKDWYGEMAKKTVIRRISKRVAMSTEIERLVRRDDAFYDLEAHKHPEGPKKSRLQTLIDKNSCSLPAPTGSGLELETNTHAAIDQEGA
jgi:recombination protein RecT